MENDNLSKIRDLMLARVRGQGGTLGTLLNQWQGKQFNEDHSVMDSYRPPAPQQGYVNTEEPLGPPSILGGLLSLDPTEYIGPQTLAKLAAGAKGLLSGAALMPMVGSIRNLPALRKEAMETAQRNAAKPISEVGLGLPKDNTAMDRAKAMGFDTDVYHGGTNDFTQFRGSRPVYATDEPRIADIYANAIGRHAALREINASPNVMSLKLRGKQLEVSDLGEGGGGWLSDNLAKALGVKRERQLVNKLPEHGYDYMKATNMSDLGGVQNQYMIPAGSPNIRSRFAAFDPARSKESDLLGRATVPAMGAAGLLGLLGFEAIRRNQEQ